MMEELLKRLDQRNIDKVELEKQLKDIDGKILALRAQGEQTARLLCQVNGAIVELTELLNTPVPELVAK